MEKENIDFYTNSLIIYGSEYEITLRFANSLAEVQRGEEADGLPIQEIGICNVRMSPQHAKATAALLIKHIRIYEKEHGVKLPLPENVKKIWDEFVEEKEND